INKDVGIIESEIGFKEIAKRFRENKPIFIRHINPSQIDINLNNTNKDIENLLLTVKPLLTILDKDKSFSVQTRILDKENKEDVNKRIYSTYEVNEELSKEIGKTGTTLDVKNPEQVLSVIIYKNKAYLGISLTEENLSSWAGGKRRLAKDENQISRSEFKLIEAIKEFQLNIPQKKQSLDLGASPGGWTRILRTYNHRVTAVDPADLHPSLVTDKKVSHIRKRAQDFLKTNTKNFDIMVNDMRLDIETSVNIMKISAEHLNQNGLAIMTMKLPKKQIQKSINKSLDKLQIHYKLIGARHLFHNRHEITVVLTSK
ncbi:MAG: SAM-dependent methyltransferase, partial [Spirochaetota bacterium]